MTRLVWPPLEWGNRTVTVVSDGHLRLDGGAMFGVVPRVLWEQKTAPDERNRIRLGMNCLLVEGPESRTLIELGVGGKEDAKFRDLYGIEREGGMTTRLSEIGVERESIDRVIVTHLHFDHTGGATSWAEDGEKVVPTFPNATYFIHEGEYAAAKNPDDRSRASYLEPNFEPLVAQGIVEWVTDGSQVDSGVTIFETPGHTAHHCSVAITDGAGRRLVFLGDLVPTIDHLPYPWIMAYDLYPATTLETRRELLPRAVEEGWLCGFVHDPETPLAYLRFDAKGRVQHDAERDPWSE